MTIAPVAQEIEVVRAAWNDPTTWRCAPNGAPSRLPEDWWVWVRTPSFKRWFGDWETAPALASKVLDDQGEPRVVFHGTRHAFEDFEKQAGGDAGFHFGEWEQATMRAGRLAFVKAAFLNVRSPGRSRDVGSWPSAKIQKVRASGHDGVVYLNRYEGLRLDHVVEAAEARVDVDRLAPAVFRKWFPEAQDSWLVLDLDQIATVWSGPAIEYAHKQAYGLDSVKEASPKKTSRPAGRLR